MSRWSGRWAAGGVEGPTPSTPKPHHFQKEFGPYHLDSCGYSFTVLPVRFTTARDKTVTLHCKVLDFSGPDDVLSSRQRKWRDGTLEFSVLLLGSPDFPVYCSGCVGSLPRRSAVAAQRRRRSAVAVPPSPFCGWCCHRCPGEVAPPPGWLARGGHFQPLSFTHPL